MTPTDELCASFIKRAKKLPKEYRLKLLYELMKIEKELTT